MPDKIQSVRWTVGMAATEFGNDRKFITRQLKAVGTLPGEDGKFSTRQIAEAIYGSAKLEHEARAAKFQQQIDEAEIKSNERGVQEGQLGYVSQMRDFVADMTTRFVQMSRQSSLNEAEKKQQMAEITGMKFEPTKILPFKK